LPAAGPTGSIWGMPTLPAQRSDGWRTFAVATMVVVGIYDLLWGISAVATDDRYIVDELVFGDFGFWGVVYILFGLAYLASAPGVYRGSRTAVLVAIVVTVLSVLDALASLGVEPLWAIAVLVIDGFLLYALLTRVPRRA
jgi:hypothetical protein